MTQKTTEKSDIKAKQQPPSGKPPVAAQPSRLNPVDYNSVGAVRSEVAGATDLLKNIPFEVLLGGPLEAAVNAQARSSFATLQFILLTLYGGKGIKEELKGKIGKASDCIPEIEDGTKVVTVSLSFMSGNKKVQIVVPLITILPIPFIEIQTLDVNFDANISSFQRTANSHQSQTSYDGSTTIGGWFGGYTFDSGIRASTTSSSNSSSGTDVDYSLNVNMHAGNVSMPAGLNRVFDMLDQAITSEVTAAIEFLNTSAKYNTSSKEVKVTGEIKDIVEITSKDKVTLEILGADGTTKVTAKQASITGSKFTSELTYSSDGHQAGDYVLALYKGDTAKIDITPT